MTPEEFDFEMKQCYETDKGDPEMGHYLADHEMIKALRYIGYGAGCDRFEEMERWYA